MPKTHSTKMPLLHSSFSIACYHTIVLCVGEESSFFTVNNEFIFVPLSIVIYLTNHHVNHCLFFRHRYYFIILLDYKLFITSRPGKRNRQILGTQYLCWWKIWEWEFPLTVNAFKSQHQRFFCPWSKRKQCLSEASPVAPFNAATSLITQMLQTLDEHLLEFDPFKLIKR